MVKGKRWDGSLSGRINGKGFFFFLTLKEHDVDSKGKEVRERDSIFKRKRC